ncbi:neuromedin-U receptor 2-like [Asterias amurensis]|uniref:neuromedin-U receptor 2-like n=1 Tax=Asterias amurensis TaxID=7602 RepID=UPI003AB5A767
MGAIVVSTEDICMDLTLNYSHDEEAATWLLYYPADRVIVPFVMSTVMAFGLLTNLAFLLVVVRVHRMRTATNHYLVQIALSDMAFLIFGAGARIMYFRASPVSSDHRMAGAAGCIVIPFLNSMAYFASLFFTALVTREKYLAVCRPLEHRMLRGRPRIIRLTLSVWCVAVLISATLIPASYLFEPFCIKWPDSWSTKTNLPDIAATCEPLSRNWVWYNNSMQTVPFFLTMFLTITMCITILRNPHFRVAPAQDGKHLGPATARKIRTRHQITLMLVVNGLVCFSLLAPFECSSIAAWLRTLVPHPLLSDDQFNLSTQIVRILAYLQAAINPIVYYIVHPSYRSAFFELFKRSKRLDPNGKTQSTQFCNTVA